MNGIFVRIDYLMDAMEEKALLLKREAEPGGRDSRPKTVALRSSSNAGTSWEYYINGAEREARIFSDDTSARILNKEVSFYLYDHLGNTRVVYKVDGYLDSVITINNIDFVADYFPYGKIVRKYVNGQEERFLTTQHERDEETGLDYRGARYYDSDVARFLSLDPLAANYPSLSDYCYVAGNPIIFIDPTGKSIDNTAGWDTEGHQQLAEAFGIVQLQYKDDPREEEQMTSLSLDVLEALSEINVDDPPKKKSPIRSFRPKDKSSSTPNHELVFEAGKTYSIHSSYSEPISYGGGSYSKLVLSYQGESIETSGFAIGFELQVGGFSGMHKYEVTFMKTMKGSSLLDVFQQTDEINSFTIGGILNYTSLTGLTQDSEELWKISGVGAGFSAGCGGSQSKCNFE